MNETTRTIPRIRLVARIAAVLCLLGAVALLPVMAYAAVVTTPNPTLPATAANDKVVTLSATDSASPGTSTTTFFKPCWRATFTADSVASPRLQRMPATPQAASMAAADSAEFS